ncbi:hypothetical protein N665_1821s0003 [Sinapis alba]|nr:hypothetical protein N665_1821s0003 [Sinapis alba]
MVLFHLFLFLLYMMLSISLMHTKNDNFLRSITHDVDKAKREIHCLLHHRSRRFQNCSHEAAALKPNGKSPAFSNNEHEVMFFNDLSLGPHESELRFRLIHFWEARSASHRRTGKCYSRIHTARKN